MALFPRGKGSYRSTEHNIDVYALAKMLGDREAQEHASRFVSSMYGYNPEVPNAYATGTASKVLCDTQLGVPWVIAADTQFWNLLADADPDPERKEASVAFAVRPESAGGLLAQDVDWFARGPSMHGVRFTNLGHGVQWENTASAVMGLGYYHSVYRHGGAEETLVSMRQSLLRQLDRYGYVLASVLGGNFEAYHRKDYQAAFPGGSDTGLGWTYLRYPHTAATAWTGLMLLEANPLAAPPGGAPHGPGEAVGPTNGVCTSR